MRPLHRLLWSFWFPSRVTVFHARNCFYSILLDILLILFCSAGLECLLDFWVFSRERKAIKNLLQGGEGMGRKGTDKINQEIVQCIPFWFPYYQTTIQVLTMASFLKRLFHFFHFLHSNMMFCFVFNLKIIIFFHFYYRPRLFLFFNLELILVMFSCLLLLWMLKKTE